LGSLLVELPNGDVRRRESQLCTQKDDTSAARLPRLRIAERQRPAAVSFKSGAGGHDELTNVEPET
jgi:hypothetical protein